MHDCVEYVPINAHHAPTTSDQCLCAMWEAEGCLSHRHPGKARRRSEEDLGYSVQSRAAASA